MLPHRGKFLRAGDKELDMEYTAEQRFFQLLLKVYVWLLKQAYCLDNNQQEIKLMSNYVVKDDNPDVGFKLTLGEVKDAEGNVIATPEGLVAEILSTNDGVLQFTPTDGFTPTGNELAEGSVKLGSPGQANLNYNVKDAAGNVLGTGSDGFTVTTGDPASIAGISAQFDGLTPVPETPAAAPEAAPQA
jgi:hypothetical protein